MSTKELTVINPFTEEAALTLPSLGLDEVDGVVRRAREAYRGWRGSSFAERTALCNAFIAAFEKMRDKVAADITMQMGKPLQQAKNEVGGLIERATYMTSIAEETLQDEWLPDKPKFKRYIRHEPLGVVFDIAAWNYPLLIAVNVVVPAVLAGNAVLIKHSSKTPLCAKAFVEAFRRAGAPDGLVQDVVADHAVTDHLIRHPDVAFVSFTGSVRGGHEVVQSAAGRFIGTGLELGGKDPAYVRKDADLTFAIDNVVDGAYFNSGQSCCGIERVYVDEAVYDAFVEGSVDLVKKYVLGDPLKNEVTLGPVVNVSSARAIQDQVDQAVAAGAKALIDPKHFPAASPGTTYLAPQLLVDVHHKMDVMYEETFGPVVGIMKVKSDEEAVRLMNDSPYGLTASIWTSDEEAALRIGGQIETGTVFMNRCDYLDPELAWVGVKNSGRGCTLSKVGYEYLTRPKSFHYRTQIPK